MPAESQIVYDEIDQETMHAGVRAQRDSLRREGNPQQVTNIQRNFTLQMTGPGEPLELAQVTIELAKICKDLQSGRHCEYRRKLRLGQVLLLVHFSSLTGLTS